MELIYYSLAVILLSVYVLTNPICKLNTYFDSWTYECESCDSICTYAEIQGTVDKCNKLCPGFTTPKSTDQPIEHEDPNSYSTVAFIAITAVILVISAVGFSYWLRNKMCAKAREKQQEKKQTLELLPPEDRKKPVEATEENPASQELVAN